jgi:error-prone DNA polymerase
VTDIIKGFPRHISIHSGGFTLSATPITEIVPVEPARMEGRTIVQWDKYDLDILGLLKIDVLSLGMLSALRKMLALIGKELHELPKEDPETYKMICRRDTVGTFQIESRAQMQMLGRLQPKNFYELVIEVAIVRPGPIVGQMVHPYLKRKRGLEKIEFPNEKVKTILEKTLGIPLFQEQVMKMAIELAGFTPGEADQLRRSINAWRSSEPIAKMADRLKQGLVAHGLSEKFAQQIFDQIQGFSEYGFPESHAASFALLAYASCYLKKYHPAEFACSLVNSQPMGFYRNDTILYDAIRHGVKVLPVCIHKSEWNCTIETPNTIRLGFRVVQGLPQKDVEALLEERIREPFADMHDFLKRTRIKQNVLSRLAMAGRFQDFKFEARDALWALLEYSHMLSEKNPQQLSLFHQNSWDTENTQTRNFKPLQNFEKIQMDYEGFSLSTQGHPMQELRRSIPNLPKKTSRDIQKMQTGDYVKTAGLTLIRQRPPTAKGVVFATLEDEFGFIDVVLQPKVFEKYREVFLQNCFIAVYGRLQRDLNTVSLSAQQVSAVLTPLTLEPDQYFYA